MAKPKKAWDEVKLPVVGKDVISPGKAGKFELRIYDHVPAVNPLDFGCPDDWPVFDLAPYFITTGEAGEKLKFVLKQWERQLNTVAQLVTGGNCLKSVDYANACSRAMVQATRLLDLLIAVRGDAQWLESTWSDDHVLELRRTSSRLSEAIGRGESADDLVERERKRKQQAENHRRWREKKRGELPS